MLFALALVAATTSYPDVRFERDVDLVGVVGALAGADKVSADFYVPDLPYVRALRKEFAPYKDHEAVKLYREAALRGMSDLESGILFEQLPAPIAEKFGGRDFRAALEDFARASFFDPKWRDLEPMRAALVEQVRGQARKLDVRGKLEAYSGLKVPPYTLILNVFGPPVLTGHTKDRSLFGPDGRRKRFELHTRLGSLSAELLTIMLPETPWRRDVALAAGSILHERHVSKEMGRLWLQKMPRVGLMRFESVRRQLERHQGPLSAFIPLDEAVPPPPWTGSLADFWRENPHATVVREPQTVYIPAGPAILIGTTGWLAPVWDLPLRVTAKGVSWKRTDRGDPGAELRGRLAVITVGRHTHPLLIVTAADPALIPEAMPRDSGEADFLILDGTTTVKAGRYERTLLPWRVK